MTQKPSRREKEKLRQRQEIMAAALTLFSEKGYHNVSMHEIAAKSKYSIGTLYKFFRNKEALYNDLIIELSDRFHTVLSKAIESPGDEIEKLRRYVQAKGEFFQDTAVTIRLYFAETQGDSSNIIDRRDQDIRKRREDILERIAKIFESGIRAGRFRPIAEPYILAVSLHSLCNEFLFLWLENPEKHSYPKNSDETLNILFKSLV